MNILNLLVVIEHTRMSSDPNHTQKPLLPADLGLEKLKIPLAGRELLNSPKTFQPELNQLLGDLVSEKLGLSENIPETKGHNHKMCPQF